MNRFDAVKPTRSELVDAGFTLLLVVLALSGFHTSLGGYGFLVTGALASLLGCVVGHLIRRARLTGLVAVACGLAVCVVLAGPIALRDDALFGVLPAPGTITGLADGVTNGWRRLLTSSTPAGGLGHLMAIPYVLGYTAALVSTLVAARPKRLLSVLLAPAAVLAASVLFGTVEPYSTVMQGALFAAAAVAWLAVRKSRDRQAYLQSHGRKRLAMAGAMLALFSVAGLGIGPRLPGAAANDRFVLRDDPPFDPSSLGSPLNGFQRYINGALKDEVLFTVEGLPDRETLVRLAVLDDYDGIVWKASADSGSGSGRFRRVGEEIPTEVVGEPSSIEVTIGALPGVWVPSVGAVTGISWTGSGDRNSVLRDVYRQSTVTSSGVVPLAEGWAEGDSYRIKVVVADEPVDGDLQTADVDGSVRNDLATNVPEELANLAAAITKGKATPLAQALALEAWFLDNGYYTSGDVASGERPNNPGHNLARLIRFVANDQPDGNAEQYAAAMALLARSVELPARVVMGFKAAPGETEIRGTDVDAWVEIAFEGGQWRSFDPTPRDKKDAPTQQQKTQRPTFESQELPPPPLPPEQPPEPQTKEGAERKRPETPKVPDPTAKGADGLGVVVGAVAGGLGTVAVVPAVTISALKRRRVRRRKRAERATSRIAGGWSELLDQARDIGLPVSARATRRETALLLGPDVLGPLAAGADAAVFGGGEPANEEVDAYWLSVDQARRQLREPLSLWQRARLLYSVTSLRPLR